MERKTLLDLLRDARFSDGLFCPRCGDRDVQGWGSFSGRQRYRCKSCCRTFSDLTGTPAAYLKKIELLPAYCGCLADQASIRRCALGLGIHPSTAFRWRHRLLEWLHEEGTNAMSGWIELGSFWLPLSHKGQRGVEHGPGDSLRRGRWDRWNLFYEGPRVHVAVACDRTGRVVSSACSHPTRGPLTVGAMEAALEGTISRDGTATLTASHESRSAARLFATRIGATYNDILPGRRLPFRTRGWGYGSTGRSEGPTRQRPGERSLVHARTVVSYIRRLRAWLRRFRGVATKYLPNYLLWHRLVDSDVRNRFQSLVLRWPLRPVEGS